jgi:hypothetical protein
MKTISAGVLLAALAACPAFAQGFDRPRVDLNGIEISRARAAALRQCSILARRVPEMK